MEQLAANVGLCKDCNYSLRDLPGNRCPECGREIDPNDLATMNMGKPMGPVARWILGPIGWPGVAVVMLPMLWWWWVTRTPGFYYMGFPIIFTVVMCVGVAVLHLVWLGIRTITAKELLQPNPVYNVRSQRLRRWMILTLLVMAIGVPLRFPLYVAFVLSKPAMDKFAHAYFTNPASLPAGGQYQVGLYTFDLTRINRDEGDLCLFRYVDGSEGGFAYSSSGFQAYHIAADSYGWLSGNWYWFCEE